MGHGTRGDTGGTWGQAHSGTTGDQWDAGCCGWGVGTTGTLGQRYPGVQGRGGRLGQDGDSHTWGHGDSWDMGTVAPWCAGMRGMAGTPGTATRRDGWDMGTAIPWGATFGMWGRGDRRRDGWDTGTAAPQGVGTATRGGSRGGWDLGVAGTQGQPRLGTQRQPYAGMLCVGTAGTSPLPAPSVPRPHGGPRPVPAPPGHPTGR